MAVLDFLLLCTLMVATAAFEGSAAPQWTRRPPDNTYAYLGGRATLAWSFDSGRNTLIIGRWGPEANNIFDFLYVSWIQGSMPVIHKENEVNFINNGTLVFYNVSHNHSRSYGCELNFKEYIMFDAAQLTVVSFQEHTKTQRIQTATELGNLTVYAYVFGTPVPQVAWLKDGQPIGSPTFTSSVFVDGFSGNFTVYRITLKASNVTRHFSGFYQVRTRYEGLPDVVISSVEVKIKYSPGDTTKFTVDKLLTQHGIRVILTCSALSYPSPRYTITKGGDFLKNDTIGLHVIDSMTYEDEGAYECYPTNEMGRGEMRVILLQYGVSPVILDTNSSHEVSSQENFSFSCRAEGRPAPLLTMKRNWKPVAIDGKKFSLTQNSSGVLTRVTLTAQLGPPFDEDGGYYICLASNDHGEAVLAVQITVFYPPVFIRNGVPMNVTGRRGQSRSLECSASAQPGPLLYTWYFMGQPLQRYTNNSFGMLQLVNLSDSDQGWYTCIVTNGKMTLMGRAYVTLNADDSNVGQILESHPFDHTSWLIPLLVAVSLLAITILVVGLCRRRRALLKAEVGLKVQDDSSQTGSNQILCAKEFVDIDADNAEKLTVNPVFLPRVGGTTRQAVTRHPVYIPTEAEIQAGKEEIEVTLNFAEDTSRKRDYDQIADKGITHSKFEDDHKSMTFRKLSEKVDTFNRTKFGPKFIPDLEFHHGVLNQQHDQERSRQNVAKYVDSLFNFQDADDQGST